MPTNKLTDAKCKAAKPGPKLIKLADGHGLALCILPSGVKSWRRFFRVDGKMQTETYGLYPAVSLAQARQRAQEARQGPQEPKRVAAAGITLQAAVETYWAARRDVRPSYAAQELRRMEVAILPDLGNCLVSSITRAKLLEVLLRIDARGHSEAARRALRGVGQVLEWCVELEHCPTNVARLIRPARAFAGRRVEGHAALPVADVPAFMQRLEAESAIQSVLAMKLLALTWVRTGELRGMRWTEIERDERGRAVRWRVPAERMKMRRGVDHLVPLSRQAVAIIDRLKQCAGRGPFVLPSERTQDRPISDAAILALIARMGYRGRMTGHGWRSIASTWANEAGFTPDAIERQLAHMPADPVRAAYNSAQWLPERARMLQAYADWLLPSDLAKA